MIDATKFAAPSRPEPYPDGKVRAFRFGSTSPKLAAAELRKFADAIESGVILLQGVQSGQKAPIDDYALQALYIEFAERAEVPERPEAVTKALYGGGRSFPQDIQP